MRCDAACCLVVRAPSRMMLCILTATAAALAKTSMLDHSFGYSGSARTAISGSGELCGSSELRVPLPSQSTAS